jgi:hypothetical protein
MASKEGTQVFLRVRPLNERERTTTAAARCLQVQDTNSLLYTGRDAPANNQFGFDRVYGENTTQAEAFEVCCRRWGRQQRQRTCRQPGAGLPAVSAGGSRVRGAGGASRSNAASAVCGALQGLKDTVQAVLHGYNGTILAFGQTVSPLPWPCGRRLPLTAQCLPPPCAVCTGHRLPHNHLPALPSSLPPTRTPSAGLQGSGKTHTLLGDVSNPSERGVVPRAVAEVAKGIAEYPEPCKFKARLGWAGRI